MPTAPAQSIAILGAGVTGLTAAFRLTQRGHRVRVFEQSTHVGGAVRTTHTGGWLIEAGPNSLLSGEPALAALLADLGLDAEVVPASAFAKNRYIVRRGRLVPVPLSPPDFLRTSLFSPLGKLRIATEWLARPRTRIGDLSLAEFMRGHFGREFVDYALNPFVTGVYAGNPEKLSARHAFPRLWALEQKHGSLLRAQATLARERRHRGEAAPAIFSFRRGLQTLVDALVARIPAGAISTQIALEAIIPGEKWSVVWNDAGGTHSQSFDAVVVALPAHALAQLRIGALGERPLAALDAVEHPPVTSLFLGYRRAQVAHALDGFGVLVPALERRSVLGVLFSSSLFPERAPDDHVALTVMVGGSRQPEIAALPTPALLNRIRDDLAGWLGVTGEPAFVHAHAWPRAIPQYNVGYEQFLATINATERAHPRLLIGGQARDGISLPACLAAGEKLAARAG